jgi:outer membrane protein, adhesin transport system
MKKTVNKRWMVAPLLCAGLLATPTLSAHSLAQAVQLALMHNPEVLSARQGMGVASEQLDQAKTGWMPTVDLTVDVGREHINKEGADPTRMTKNISSLTFKQPIFDGGATSASVTRSDQMQHVSTIHFDEIRTSVTLKAIETWHELFQLQRVIKLTEANVGEHRQLYIQIKQKVEAGGAGRAELVAAETPWLLAQNALITARGDYQDALAKYTAVVGVEPIEKLGSGLNVGDDDLPQDLSAAVQLLLDNNFILRTAQANLLAAKADHQGSKAGLLPTLDFELKEGRKQNDGGAQSIDRDTTALLKLNYNLFNGGADQSRRRETARSVLDSQEQLTLAHRNMAEQLTQYWNGLEVSRMLLNTSHQQLGIAKENHHSAQEQFKLGEGDVMAIMAASDALLVAKKSVLSDEIDVHLGRYRLLSHTGVLLQHVKAADVMLVMQQMDDRDLGDEQGGWLDRLVSRVGSAPLLSQSEILDQEHKREMASLSENTTEGKVVDAHWDDAYSQMRDAGWVVLNAVDQEKSDNRLPARAPAQPVVVEKEVGSSMMMVGGGMNINGAEFKHNRAERRRLDLRRRLGSYRERSGDYQRSISHKQAQLGTRQLALKNGKAQYDRRLAKKSLVVR